MRSCQPFNHQPPLCAAGASACYLKRVAGGDEVPESGCCGYHVVQDSFRVLGQLYVIDSAAPIAYEVVVVPHQPLSQLVANDATGSMMRGKDARPGQYGQGTVQRRQRNILVKVLVQLRGGSGSFRSGKGPYHLSPAPGVPDLLRCQARHGLLLDLCADHVLPCLYHCASHLGTPRWVTAYQPAAFILAVA